MARAYWFSIGLKLADDDSDAGFGSGSRMEFRHDGIWLTDKQIDEQAARYTESIARDLKYIRDREMRLDRDAAKPFWLNWFG